MNIVSKLKGSFRFECLSNFNVSLLLQSIYFDVENPKMKIILWRNYLLTLKLAYIYPYFTDILRFLCALSPRKLT